DETRKTNQMQEMTNGISDQTVDLAHLKRQKRIVLAVMLLLSALFGVVDSLLASVSSWERTSFILDTASFTFCVMAWCSFDALSRGFRLTSRLRWTIFLIAVAGFPIYAFRSRGRQGWTLLGLGVG